MALRSAATPPSTSGRCFAPSVAQPRRRHCMQLRASAVQTANEQGEDLAAISPDLKNKTVLILGGSGRVGSSTASAMMKQGIGGTVIVGSRSQETLQAAVERRPELRDAQFRATDVDDPQSLLKALRGVDMVLHCAGPFQFKEQCAVLEAAIASGVPYIDICDDQAYSQRAKALCQKAADAGVPAITTAGIYPGVSNVMAAHMVSIARREYDDEWNYRQRPERGSSEQGTDPSRVLYSYFTAGTGGAGPTILETSLLLAGEDVIAFKDGKQLTLPPVSNVRFVDFGTGLGRRSVWLYNLPEVLSARQVFGVPSCSARFGTDPDIWNWAMWATARAFPRSFLSNRDAVRGFVRLLDPIVRPLDKLVGERVAMKIEVDMQDGTNATGLYVHKRLSESVGIATAAFVHNMLAGGCQPGVWFPEEQQAVADRRKLLHLATQGADRFLLNKASWELELNAVKVGMGFYI